MDPVTLSFPVVSFPDADEATGCGFNYNEWETRPTAVRVEKAVVVRNGTAEGRATVDLILNDAAGNRYVVTTTAALLGVLYKASTPPNERV